ncbi:3-oxoacyl-ACP reductase FabG [Nocardioides ginsengisoli]|uniref:3-oxoacyl-ACP reductase FabG n=1 Tax=Nocardioides ginsengisoli TaxID=363868 RepID=A0ABW3W5P7_9ACTN
MQGQLQEYPHGSAARVAIVTGAARGIGAATARRLAAGGRAVAVLDLDLDACAVVRDEIVAAGGTALAVSADVTDETAVDRAVEEIVEGLGAPTILVNNAGITRDNLLFKMSVDDWDAVVQVHLRGAFLMTRAAQRHMVAQRFGRIVNLSSTSALGNRGQANYAAAKAGIQGLTRTLAVELGPFGVTANAVAPGFVQTEMTAATAERLGLTFEEFTARAIAKIPVGRGGQPEDIAAVVHFLTSDESGYVSGQVLYVDGARRG